MRHLQLAVTLALCLFGTFVKCFGDPPNVHKSIKSIDFGNVALGTSKELPVTYTYGIAIQGPCFRGTVVDALHIVGSDAHDFHIDAEKDGMTGHTLGASSHISANIIFTPDPKKGGREETAQLVVDTHGVDPNCKTLFVPCDLFGNRTDKVDPLPKPVPVPAKEGKVTMYAQPDLHHIIAITDSEGTFTFGFGPVSAPPFGDGWLPLAPGRVDEGNKPYANISGARAVASYTLPDEQAKQLVEDLRQMALDPDWYILFLNDCQSFALTAFPDNPDGLLHSELGYLETLMGIGDPNKFY